MQKANDTLINFDSITASDMDFIGSFMNMFLDAHLSQNDDDHVDQRSVKMTITRDDMVALVNESFNNFGISHQGYINNMLELFVEENIRRY